VSEVTERLCPSCGKTSPADSRFCRECGVILERGGGSKAPPPSDRGAAASPPPRSPRRLVPWLAALGVVAALGLVIHFRQETPPQLPVPGVPPTQVTALPTAAATVEPARLPTPARPTVVPSPNHSAEPLSRPHPVETAASRATSPERRESLPRSALEGSVRQRPGWYRMRFRAPLFQAPSETAPVVTYLPQGMRIRVTRALPGFLAVESMTGKPPGYVSSDDAAPERPTE